MGKWHTIASSDAADIGDDLTPPGNVTIGTITYRYLDVKTEGTPDREGLRELILTVPYTAPDPLGTFKGVQAWVEYPDQSGAPTLVFDGATEMNGTNVLAGPWEPQSHGKTPYVAAGNPPVVIRGLRPVTVATTIRVYLASYSSTIDNPLVRATAPSPTPNATVAVALPPTGASGEEHCRNVTDWNVTVTTAIEGGIDTTRVICTFTKPNDPRWTQVRPTIRGYYPTDVVLGVETESPSREFKFPTPTDGAKLVLCYGVSGSDPAGTADPADDSVNTIVHGVTPHKQVTIGGTLGTLDLSQSIAGTLGPALSVIADKLTLEVGPALDTALGSLNLVLGQGLSSALDKVDLVLGAALGIVNNALDVPNGAIVAAHITSVNASAVTGLIVANQIDTLTAGQITGLIAANQINSITAGQITGLIAAGQIQSLTAGQITGLILASQINTLNAEKITGVLVSTQIGSVNANTITIGLITNGQIDTIAAGKITAGTITASVSMTSPNITSTSGSDVVSLTSGVIKASSSTLELVMIAGSANFRPISGGSDVSTFISNSGVFCLDTGGFSRATMTQATGVRINAATAINRISLTESAANFISCPIQINGAIVIDSSAFFDFRAGTTTTASAGAQTLPANPVGFLRVKLSGSEVRIPYYDT